MCPGVSTKLLVLAVLLGWASTCAPATANSIDWATYGFDSVRSSNNSVESTLTPDTVANLKHVWTYHPGPYDAAQSPPLLAGNAQLRGQAIVASGVSVHGTLHDLVLFGDNNGTFFALDAAKGTLVWASKLGYTVKDTPKVTIMGVFGTAAVDRAAHGGAGVVYAASHEKVHALDLTSGEELSGWPVSVSPNGPPTDGAIHSGINVVNGQVYVTTGSSGNELPVFFGRVVRIAGAAPSVMKTWYVIGGSTTQPTISGGGIWGWGGVAIDTSATAGGLYAASGNRIGTNGQVPNYSEEIFNLTPALDQLLSYGSPALKGPDNDYSSPTIFQPKGCAGKFLAVTNKTGLLVLDSISASGTLSIVATLQVGQPPGTLGYKGIFRTTLAWDAADDLLLVTNPLSTSTPFAPGLIAFKFHKTCAAPYLTTAWQMPPQSGGPPTVSLASDISSPTVANGVAYFGSGRLTVASKTLSYVYAVATATTSNHKAGDLLWQSPALNLCSVNNAPTVVNGRLFVVCTGNVPAVEMFDLP